MDKLPMNKDKSEYRPSEIESKWQKYWEENRVFSPDLKNAKNPYYTLMMFPYPSAEGLHIGNMYAFTGADIHGRYMRMKGKDVFEPIGLDGFGIHSENYAIKVGKHPREQAKISEKNFYRQLRATGNAYDWTRTLGTYDADYYRWTQWIFVQMFKKGLAYRKKAQVNWCPSDKTVLADEQVIDGRCERCSSVVEKRDLEQWFFKITAYADALLNGLSQIDWPEKIKIAQRLWIGRSEDTEIDFPIVGSDIRVKVITTRADTIFGATFLVLAPEHELVQVMKSKIKNWSEVDKYIKETQSKTDFERGQMKDKTGVQLKGIRAINPVNNEEIPVFIADYVLASYGTGAIMAVPAHDDRDFEFAKKFDLSIRYVIEQPKTADILRVHIDDQDRSDIAQELRKMGKEMEYWTPTLRRYDINIENKEKVAFLLQKAGIGSKQDFERIRKGDSFALEFSPAGIDFGTVYAGDGVHINSDFLNGLKNLEAIEEMMNWLSEKGFGGKSVHYHLRDWLISRQRYWGPPIPMIFCPTCEKNGRGEREDMPGWWTVPENQLPVLLPDVEDWRPEGSGTSPLANHPEFYETKCPSCNNQARRETDVSDTFLDSSWYYLRYLSIGNEKKQTNSSQSIKKHQQSIVSGQLSMVPYDLSVIRRWCPVAIYIGGAEHSVLHLLYVRFVAMVLHDLNLDNRSQITDNGSKSNIQYPISNIQDLALPFEEPFPRFYAHGLLISEGAKMSKSRGNIIVPDDYIKKFGADTLRLYLMFLGPFDHGGNFRDTGIEGMNRFVRRVWKLFATKGFDKDKGDTLRMINKTIKEVTEDIESFSYNTAIAKFMEFYNFISGDSNSWSKDTAMSYLKLFAPFAPYFTEELFESLKLGDGTIHESAWPKYDERYLVQEKVNVVVQVNGKRRGEITVDSSSMDKKEEVEAFARREVKKYVSGSTVKKVIHVPGRIINFVI